MSLAKALVYGYAWALLAGLVVYAYAEGISRVDAEDPVHSGARPDSRHYVAVDPSSPEAVTSSGYAEANAL